MEETGCFFSFCVIGTVYSSQLPSRRDKVKSACSFLRTAIMTVMKFKVQSCILTKKENPPLNKVPIGVRFGDKKQRKHLVHA